MIAAFDTELFGHWWYEGPDVARATAARPARGGRHRRNPARCAGEQLRRHPVELPPGSWGSGKDWQVWAGEKVADFVQLNAEVVDTALSTVDKALARTTPRRLGIWWPSDSARDAADGVQRLAVHGEQGLPPRTTPATGRTCTPATREIADALASGRREAAVRLAEGWNRADGLFGALDARRLPR